MDERDKLPTPTRATHDDLWSMLYRRLLRAKEFCYGYLVGHLLLSALNFRLLKLCLKSDYLIFKTEVFLLKLDYADFRKRNFLCDILWDRDVRKDFFQIFKERHFFAPNVELTGAARLYRAASSDQRERG